MQHDPARLEECRYAVLHYLAVRSTLAQDVPTITRGLARQYDFQDYEIAGALAFLDDLGHVKRTRAAMGSTAYYQITAQGQLADERGE
jgi:hypothetical protein